MRVTLPPAQNDALPDGVIAGVNTPMLMLALPLDEQPLEVAVTLIDTGDAVPTEKVIDEVPWPVCSVPLVTDHVYVAPPTGLVMLVVAVLFGQTDAGALIAAEGGALTVTDCGVDVPVQPAESATVTL